MSDKLIRKLRIQSARQRFRYELHNIETEYQKPNRSVDDSGGFPCNTTGDGRIAESQLLLEEISEKAPRENPTIHISVHDHEIRSDVETCKEFLANMSKPNISYSVEVRSSSLLVEGSTFCIGDVIVISSAASSEEFVGFIAGIDDFAINVRSGAGLTFKVQIALIRSGSLMIRCDQDFREWVNDLNDLKIST